MKSKLSLLGVLALAFAMALAGCGTPDTAPLPGEEPPGLEEPLTPGAEEDLTPSPEAEGTAAPEAEETPDIITANATRNVKKGFPNARCV